MPPPAANRVPATAALQHLLHHVGVTVRESLLFLQAGGIGAGVFAFHYERENSASLFLAGRHLWADDLAYLTAAAKRLGASTTVRETTSVRTAEQQLREALAGGQPVIAWVDMAHLPHRAMPSHFSGGGYHVVTVDSIDGDTALIHDLAPAPIAIPLRDLSSARGRIAKFRNRLFWLSGGLKKRPDAAAVTRDALRTCVTALAKAKMSNFRLDAFAELAERMAGHGGKESWEVMFPAGARLWTALTSLHQYIEHYGTGGGLCRTIFAEGLREAGRADDAERYAALGRRWSALAAAALPGDIPACHEATELFARRSSLIGTSAPVAELRAVWERLGRLAQECQRKFPLPATRVKELSAALSAQLRVIHAEEVAALASLAALNP
ncbi:MAG: BtrH N-terminal domain-containing protein [Gemmatimonadales bacterium]